MYRYAINTVYTERRRRRTEKLGRIRQKLYNITVENSRRGHWQVV